MFCTDCGKQNQRAVRYCYACGNALKNGAQLQTCLAETKSQNAGVLPSLGNRISRLASTDQLEGFSLRRFFSEVFKKREKEEIDDYLVVGTNRTTPCIEERNWQAAGGHCCGTAV
jgi:hypothetical protein